MTNEDVFSARRTLETTSGPVTYYDVNSLEEQGVGQVSRLPFSIKVMLESLLRNVNGYDVLEEDVRALAGWQADPGEITVPLKLARVILQDFTGVPAVVDIAALRSAMARAGADPSVINPVVPVDLVIDHSVQVDFFGTAYALSGNVEKEYERNGERYKLLKWAQGSIDNFRVVPPGAGIVHQVNLEYLGNVVMTKDEDGERVAFPDSLVGTDSHTTMINGLGVLGWGVGGIEAEAVMLDQPYYMLAPRVVGFKLSGRLPEGATATDLVLTVTEMLRAHGVVGDFVEFYGSGLTGTAGGRPCDDCEYVAGIRRDDGLFPHRRRDAGISAAFRTQPGAYRSCGEIRQGAGVCSGRMTPPIRCIQTRLSLI